MISNIYSKNNFCMRSQKRRFLQCLSEQVIIDFMEAEYQFEYVYTVFRRQRFWSHFTVITSKYIYQRSIEVISKLRDIFGSKPRNIRFVGMSNCSNCYCFFLLELLQVYIPQWICDHINNYFSWTLCKIVAYPLKHRLFVNRKIVFACLVSIWLLSCVHSTKGLIFGFNKHD